MRTIAFVLLITAASIARADWPQFHGPNRDGVADSGKLADTFPEGGPKVLWKFDKLGKGYGGAIVQGDRVYTLDRVSDQQDVLRCLKLEDGTEDWNYSYPAPPEAKDDPKLGQYKGNYNGSRNLPAVDDKNVYILGPFGDVAAISKATHQPLWAINLIKDYGMALGNWGVCQEPLLYKESVIVAPLSKQAGVLALEKASGKVMWKSDRIGDVAWTSPMLATIDGVDQVIVLHSRGNPVLTGIDATSGKTLWSYKGWAVPNPIASPTILPEGRIFLTGGYQAGCAMVQVKKDGEQWTATEVYKNKDLGAQACKPVFHNGLIYARSNDFPDKDKKEANGLMCMDAATGKVLWKLGSDNIEEIGSVIFADGKLYTYSSEKATLRIYTAGAEQPKELTSLKVGAGTNNWAPMALSDGRLLIRSGRTLFCVDVRG